MSRDFDAHVRKGAVTNFAANLLINGALAYVLLREHRALTSFGEASYGFDLLITGFLLAAIVAAIVVVTHRRQASRGELDAPASAPRWIERASARGTLPTALAFGAVGATASGIVVALLAVSAASLAPAVYAVVKGVWAGLLAAWVVRPAAALGARQGSALRLAREAA